MKKVDPLTPKGRTPLAVSTNDHAENCRLSLIDYLVKAISEFKEAVNEFRQQIKQLDPNK